MPVALQHDFLANLNNEQVAIDPARAALVASCLRNVATHPRMAELQANADQDFWFKGDDWRSQFRPYHVQDGVLMVPVAGVLLNKFPWAIGDWATGYIYIQKAVERGMTDANVRGIAFISDSPGGVVPECFEVCDKLFGFRGEKPMRTFIADRCYSAAYAIGSCANTMTSTRTGGAGSIGVYTMHVSFAGALDQAGVEVTFVKAGKFKTDGNQFEKLSPHAKQRMQKRVDEMNDTFVSTVVRNRSAALDEEKVRSLEGEATTAKESLALGLIDRVETFEEAVTAFGNECLGDQGESPMANETPAKTYSQADLDAAVVSATAQGKEAGKKEGVAEGATAERARVKGIVEHADAKGKAATALSFALSTDMSVDAAATVLKTVQAEKQGGTFKDVMDKTGGAEVGAGGGEGDEGEANEDDAVAKRINANHAALTGIKPAVKK